MIFVLWTGVAILTAIAANARGRNPVLWFVLGMAFSLFGLAAVLLMPAAQRDPDSGKSLQQLAAERSRDAVVADPYETPRPRSNPILPRVQAEGDEGFDHEVVGESHYQGALSAICGGRTEDGHEKEVECTLRCELNNQYDSNAVMVLTLKGKVGYLASADAARYRAALRAQGFGTRDVRVNGLIRGGWSRDFGADKGDFGIWLDLAVPYRFFD